MFRFRRSVKIFPGFRVNISKSGVSASVKIAKGLSANIGKKGTYFNVSIPKTGINKRVHAVNGTPNTPGAINNIDKENDGFTEIKSSNLGNLSDEVGKKIVQSIREANHQRVVLKKDLLIRQIKSILLGLVKLVSYLLIFGFFYKKPQERYIESKSIISGIKEHLDNTKVKLDVDFDSESEKAYEGLLKQYEELCNCQKIWDITNAKDNDGTKDRSGANQIIKRKITNFGLGSLNIIDSNKAPFHLKNINGTDLYIYPSHLVLNDKGKSEIDIIQLGKVRFDFSPSPFIEEERVPSDSEIIKYTWKYVNKSGGPDRRFKDNRQIPVALYGDLTISTQEGLYEKFSISNCDALQKFVKALLIHMDNLK